MNDVQVGSVVRAVRIQKHLRQADVARSAGVSPSSVSRVERGHVAGMSVEHIRAIAAVLEIRLELIARWRGGDLESLLNRRHSALHELLAKRLSKAAGWESAAEVSFSIYGERGVIDRMAFHRASGMLVIFELKADLIDPAGLVGQVDRYRRLATRIARERRWVVRDVSCWAIIGDTVPNRRRATAHEHLLRSAFPYGTRELARWLQRPASRRDGIAFLAYPRPRTITRSLTAVKRVRPFRKASR